MADGLLVERLRRYLKDLSPEARALLMTELERGVLRGTEMPGAELVLQELRREAREAARPKRPGTLARLFFQPLEPVLVDETATHNHPGRIARAVLDPVWTWIGRDLMPGETRAVTEHVARAFAAGDPTRAEDLARAFQGRAAIRMREVLAAATANDDLRRQLAARIGTPRAIDDATAILTVIAARETLSAFGARLPNRIAAFDDDRVAACLALIESPAAGAPVLFPSILVMIMGRLAAPWQLVRLAIRSAGSNDAARMATTHYAVAVDIVLAEIQRMADELKSELRSGRGLAIGALLKAIHDALRGLRGEIAFSPEAASESTPDAALESAWARRLAALHSEMSDILKGEIETLPGRLGRLLRSRPIAEIAPDSVIDQNDVRDIEARIEFVKTCRAYAAEFALGDLTTRTWAAIERELERLTAGLGEDLRKAGDSDRLFRQSQFTAAQRFGQKVFGSDDVAPRPKAGEPASPARKAAKA